MFAEIEGCTLYYESYGEGPPMVLIHGLGATANLWHGAMQSLQQHHHVIAMDLRGHGRSDGKGKFTVETWSHDVLGLIRHLELPSVTLVGHSLGSLVAQHLAQTQPGLVDSLVLVGGISYFGPEQVEAYRERADLVEKDGMDPVVEAWLNGAFSPQSRATMAGAVGLLREVFLRNDPVMYAKSCRALAKAPHIRHEEIGQPTLIVLGAHDRATPLGMAEELKRDIPVSRVRVVAHTAHWLPVEDPGSLAAAILEFLS